MRVRVLLRPRRQPHPAARHHRRHVVEHLRLHARPPGSPHARAAPGVGTTTYTYDAASNLTTVIDGGGTVTYGYDDINRQSSCSSRASPRPSRSPTRIRASTRPADRRRRPRGTRSLPNGGSRPTSSTPPVGCSTARSRLGGTVLQRFSYMYATTAPGSTARRRRPTRTPLHRLRLRHPRPGDPRGNSRALRFAYIYDAASNITTKSVRRHDRKLPLQPRQSALLAA